MTQQPYQQPGTSQRPGQMTAVMRAVAATGPKVLRIGVVQGGRVLEERIIKQRSHVTVGPSEKNLFVIAIGLGIGAMYVRSMTIMLVEKGTLSEYRYLEHGAFYAILILSVVMYFQTLVHIPEVITGLGGAVLIGIAFWASVRHNRREEHAEAKAEAVAAE